MAEKRIGQVTIPTDKDFEAETLRIMGQWGADAVRDCDGTVLSDEIIHVCDKVYKTYFVARGDNEWARSVPEERQHFYCLSRYFTADNDKTLEMFIMDGYFAEQIAPDYDCDIKRYWEVIDRTTGELLGGDRWSFDPKTGVVNLKNPIAYHEYTVSFMAYNNWDSTQMYNYITNNWTREKEVSYDARYPKTRKYIVQRMKSWLKQNPKINVVRFTTFFYHFTLMFNDKRKEKFVDWFGYSASVSPKALNDFEKEYGYRLRAEDFVDEGFYNSPFRVPRKQFLDYMDFIQRFVADATKELVDAVHAEGREAMMFLGDNWIGTEPYGKYFPSIGLDAVVGSVGGGVTVRMLSDMPGIKYTEGRFLPYFFPDTFYDGNDPVPELNRNWLTARRAILRNPIDRIGYGGYLSLAAKFPKFIDRVGEICEEFRDIYAKLKGSKPRSTVRVAMLNAWGKLRSWQCYMVAHELWYQQIYSFQGILEALSGMDADVTFLSFEEVAEHGIPNDVDVVINAGSAGTAFSGGTWWDNAKLTAHVRAWVHQGGGFIGVGEPSAQFGGGRYFRLAEIMGVDKELGYSLSTDRYNKQVMKHFVTAEIDPEKFDGGEQVNDIYALDGAQVLGYRNGTVTLAAKDYGKGRGFYAYGMRFSPENARLLRRALLWCARREEEVECNATDNAYVECNVYEDGSVALVNNSLLEQTFRYIDGNRKSESMTLSPCEIKWINNKA